MANGQPRPAFYVAVLLVVMGLVGLALWRYGALKPGGQAGQISNEELKQMKGGAEAPDSSGITTVKEYKYVAASKLPEVKGISSYKPMADRTVRFAINVWAGWGPIIYANNGFKPGKVWKSPGGKDFKVELVLIDDPVAMRDAYAAGNLHVGWATLDMIPLFLEGLRKDSRVMPRVYQQVDWSNGGDGIVVRDTIKTMADVRGKTIVLAQNSPSHYFVLNALINAGVQPAEVDFKFTQDAFQAAAAFNADKRLAGVVSWAPDIYNLEKVKGNKVLVTTSTAYFLYKKINAAKEQTPFDQVMDFSVIQKLGAEPKYSTQKNEYDIHFAPASAGSIAGEKDEILTKTVVIHFFPNSWDLNKKITRNADGKEVEELYDPNVGFIVEEVGKLAGQYGAARIIIEGHTDGSMKGQVPKSLVQELSLNRANSVKEAIVRKFGTLQPNQFSTAGMGWDRSADPSDPENHAKNRRVEIKVYPAEAGAGKEMLSRAAPG